MREGTVALAAALARSRKPRRVGVLLWAPALGVAALAFVVMSARRERMVTSTAATAVSTAGAAPTATPLDARDTVRDTARDTARGPQRELARSQSPRVAPPTAAIRADDVPRATLVHASRTDAVSFAAEPVQVARFEAAPVTRENVADQLPVLPVNHADAVRAPDIAVTNKLGSHAMVARTADPNIVVVWLSNEPTRRNP